MSNPTPDACVVDAVACVYVCPVFLYASASIEVPVDQTSSTVASPLWLLTVAVCGVSVESNPSAYTTKCSV